MMIHDLNEMIHELHRLRPALYYSVSSWLQCPVPFYEEEESLKYTAQAHGNIMKEDSLGRALDNTVARHDTNRYAEEAVCHLFEDDQRGTAM